MKHVDFAYLGICTVSFIIQVLEYTLCDINMSLHLCILWGLAASASAIKILWKCSQGYPY